MFDVRGVMLAVAFIGAAPGAMAQAPTPANVMGRLFGLAYYGQKCGVEPTAEQDAAMTNAGEKMQAKLNMTDAQVGEAFKSTAAQLPDVDCAGFKASFQQRVDTAVAAADALE